MTARATPRRKSRGHRDLLPRHHLGPKAETVAQHFDKGSEIYLEGRFSPKSGLTAREKRVTFAFRSPTSTSRRFQPRQRAATPRPASVHGEPAAGRRRDRLQLEVAAAPQLINEFARALGLPTGRRPAIFLRGIMRPEIRSHATAQVSATDRRRPRAAGAALMTDRCTACVGSFLGSITNQQAEVTAARLRSGLTFPSRSPSAPTLHT